MTLVVRSAETRESVASVLGIKPAALADFMGEELATKTHWSLEDTMLALLSALCRDSEEARNLAQLPFYRYAIDQSGTGHFEPAILPDYPGSLQDALMEIAASWVEGYGTGPVVALSRKAGKVWAGYILFRYIDAQRREIARAYIFAKGNDGGEDDELQADILTRNVWRAALTPFRIAGATLTTMTAH